MQPNKKAVRDFLKGIPHLSEEQRNEHAQFIGQNPNIYYHAKAFRQIMGMLEKHDINPKDPNCWFQLVLELMKPQLEGFGSLRKSPGRPSKWDYAKYERLYYDVELLMLNNRTKHGYNIGQACKRLATWEAWREYSPKTLRTRYSEARKDPAIRLQREYFDRLAKEGADF